VEEIAPDFVDPTTERPLRGREDQWSIVTEYRVLLAGEARRWEDAERLQKLNVEWIRQQAASTLSGLLETWDEKNRVRTLAASLHELSEIQRENGSASCVDGYQEALALAERIGDTQGAAVCAFNLGHAFSTLGQIRDLSAAERWYRRSLELYAKEDRIGRAKCLGQLGFLASQRFLAARDADQKDECVAHLAEALRSYEKVLAMLPPDAVRELAVAHHQLGVAYQNAGQIDAALDQYRKSVRFKEIPGDRFGAGNTRSNAARALAEAGRPADAREWARSALRDFEACETLTRKSSKPLN
jgi:tetratricopeptide (TPR) repeat protein